MAASKSGKTTVNSSYSTNTKKKIGGGGVLLCFTFFCSKWIPLCSKSNMKSSATRRSTPSMSTMSPFSSTVFRALWIAVLVFSLHKHNHHSHRCVDLVFSLNTHNHCSYRHAMLVFSLHKHNHHSHRCVDLVFILNTHNHCSHRHAMSVFSLNKHTP